MISNNNPLAPPPDEPMCTVFLHIMYRDDIIMSAQCVEAEDQN